MNRREFIKGSIVSLTIGMVPQAFANSPDASGDPERDQAVMNRAVRDNLPETSGVNPLQQEDVFLGKEEMLLLKSVVGRLRGIERIVGHGNFALMGFDEALSHAASYSSIGGFTSAELGFMEAIFHGDASIYGFMGKKKLLKITDTLCLKRIVKIPGTGNYLYNGSPVSTYGKIKTDVGADAVLTSGLRGIVKQMLLFFDKGLEHDGNLSLASKSLAPPGYSYHGVGDFDIGKVGFGPANFTEKFTTTTVYSSLVNTGYVSFRYTRGNRLGVRFEPWHIKVVEG